MSVYLLGDKNSHIMLYYTVLYYNVLYYAIRICIYICICSCNNAINYYHNNCRKDVECSTVQYSAVKYSTCESKLGSSTVNTSSDDDRLLAWDSLLPVLLPVQ
jgi:hypothetical protein